MTTENNMPYTVTEWEWFQLQLQLYLARHNDQMCYIGTEEPGTLNARPLRIKIAIRSTEQWIYRRISKKELLQMNMAWVYLVKDLSKKLLEHFPGLKKDLDVNRDLIFELLSDTGKASYTIAEVIGDQVAWTAYVKDLPE